MGTFKADPAFERRRDEILLDIQSIQGHLTDREARCLITLGYYPTCSGKILEIGSFKGRSTVLLAKASAFSNSSREVVVHAVDPLTSPSVTDPDLGDKRDGSEDFFHNLATHQIEEQVTFFRGFSQDLAPHWTHPIRLLWIDGDHTYEGAKSDFDLFAPYLNDAGIIAFHDVLHGYDGPLRVYMEEVLMNDHFSACALCGSIAYAQFNKDTSYGKQQIKEKLRLFRKMSRLLPYVIKGNHSSKEDKRNWKFWKLFVPHQELGFNHMMKAFRFVEGEKTPEKTR